MLSTFRCLVVIVLVCGCVNAIDISVSHEFSSKFLESGDNTAGILSLMTSHFNTSLDYLFASKFYGSQYSERQGIAKVLRDESDRHWEEGISVLKKYLHIGGTTPERRFINSMNFNHNQGMFGHSGTSQEYKESFKSVMEVSHKLGHIITDLHHAANRKSSSHGDADVAHYLEEKAEKESDVARKMVGHYMTLDKMANFGIGLDIFDKNL